MRLQKITAYGASIAMTAALLAGCSNSSPGTGLPSGGVNGAAKMPSPMQHHGTRELLKLQAEGKIAGPVPRQESERGYKYILNHAKFQVRGQSSGTPAMWATNTDYSYLVGVNKKATAVLAAVNTGSNSCFEPVTVKTDKAKNAWASCVQGPNFSLGAEQEYSGTGTLIATYNPTIGGCPTNASCYGATFDGGFDALGRHSTPVHVFVEQSYAYDFSCTTYNCFYNNLSPGVWWYTAGNPSGTPTFISLGAFDNPAEDMYYMALDSSGNIWFDYLGSQGSHFGCGVGEIANPTTSPSVNFILAPGTLGFCGGVEVNGSDLYVTDQNSRLTYEYALPLTTSSSPIATFGPTTVGLGGYGDPVSGGINNTGTTLIQGDAGGGGWMDSTTLPGNVNTALTNIDFLPAIEGAAFAKSAQP